MENSGIVPDIIDVLPTQTLKISYPSGVTVNNGNELTPTQVKDKPTISWTANDSKLYTLLFSDPDAPSRAEPTKREVRHWLVHNIPGTNIDAGDTIVEFIGSGAPEGTGLHRYVFLVFEQYSKIEVEKLPRTSNRSRSNRLNTSARTLATRYSLGNPIAGNFYLAQFDDYCTILHAQISSESQ